MDVHVRNAITSSLRLRGVEVITAQEDGAGRLRDPALLDRSTALQRELFSQDQDLLREASRRELAGESFGGVIYVHQLRLTVGQIIQDLELIAKAAQLADFANRVEFLPL